MSNLGSKLAMTALYTLAVLGSFMVAVIINVLLEAGGSGEDMAMGVALAVWVFLLAGSVFGIISLYNSNKDRAEKARTVPGSASSLDPQPQADDIDPPIYLDEGADSSGSQPSYREILIQENQRKEDSR